MPYDGARPDLYAAGSYRQHRTMFEQQIHETILLMLQLKREHIVDVRIARWRHALPIAATGLIADGTIDAIRTRFRGRVFLVEQDNRALPALRPAPPRP
jgi:hypothetical protein